MSAIDLNVFFNEESSGAIGFSMTGLDKEPVIPNTFYWTLSDLEGNVINSRTAVSETPAAKTYVVLSGLDLVYVNGTDDTRKLTIKGSYDTLVGGVAYPGLAYTAEYQFDIRRLTNIP